MNGLHFNITSNETVTNSIERGAFMCLFNFVNVTSSFDIVS